MFRMAIWLAVLSCAMGASLADATDTDLCQQVDRLVAPYIEHDIVVGMAVGVLAEGRQWSAGYGRISAAVDRSPEGQTVYEIGSITKAFTGILLGDAVAREQVTLEQAARELLPEGVTMPANGEAPIQLRHLATHTSGLPRLPDNMQPANPSNPYAAYSPDRLHTFLNGHQLRRAPGVASEYSNLAMGLLGYLLALRSAMDFDQLVAERIAQPLGMTSTAVALNPSMRERLAPPHRADGSPDANWDLSTLAGAGGLRSTVDDMLRLLAAHLEPPEGTLAKAIELAWQLQPEPTEKPAAAMGLGWHLARDGHTRWHNGQTGGYRSMALISRQNRTAVVILANTATSEVDRLAQEIFRMLAGQAVEPRRFEPEADAP
jgi:serine-type D-Ala-D-Ala carboxypeptidase/endopeptidase